MVLIGYMGDYLTDTLYNYQSARITPLNPYYGQLIDVVPDMYDIEISENIIRTMKMNLYFTEIDGLVRILIILGLTLINVLVLTITRTKWILINALLVGLWFVLITGLCTFLMLVSFDNGYFIELDELPITLIITGSFTFLMNLFPKPAEPSGHQKMVLHKTHVEYRPDGTSRDEPSK